MRIIICGDTVPTSSNISMFEDGNIDELFGARIIEAFKDADYRIVNLETPVSDTSFRIKKSGPCLCSPKKTSSVLKKLDVSLASLANNHIFDAGETGLSDTLAELDKLNIGHVGAGFCYEEIVKPYIISDGDIKVGVYSCCEHEFSVDEETNIGANPINLLRSFEDIQKLRNQVDHVIVLYHGGREQYRYPTPNQQRIMRRIVDSGADLVVAQHSHCIGCEEDYKSGKIIYGQGNFIFDRVQNDYWNTGLIVNCVVDREKLTVTYTPVQNKGDGKIRAATGVDYNDIMNGFQKRSQELISNPQIVETKFSELCDSNMLRYIRILRGDRLFDKIMIKIFGNKYIRFLYKGENAKRVCAILSCETHYEMLLKIINSL